jgi:hypothetical protein
VGALMTAHQRYQEAVAAYVEARRGTLLPARHEWVELLEQLVTSADAALAELRFVPNTARERKQIEKRKREARRTIKKLAER